MLSPALNQSLEEIQAGSQFLSFFSTDINSISPLPSFNPMKALQDIMILLNDYTLLLITYLPVWFIIIEIIRRGALKCRQKLDNQTWKFAK